MGHWFCFCGDLIGLVESVEQRVFWFYLPIKYIWRDFGCLLCRYWYSKLRTWTVKLLAGELSIFLPSNSVRRTQWQTVCVLAHKLPEHDHITMFIYNIDIFFNRNVIFLNILEYYDIFRIFSHILKYCNTTVTDWKKRKKMTLQQQKDWKL